MSTGDEITRVINYQNKPLCFTKSSVGRILPFIEQHIQLTRNFVFPGPEVHKDVRVHAICRVCGGAARRDPEEYARTCATAREDEPGEDGE